MRIRFLVLAATFALGGCQDFAREFLPSAPADANAAAPGYLDAVDAAQPSVDAGADADTSATPDPLLRARANWALKSWQADLTLDTLGYGRALGGPSNAHNPPNWVSSSGPDCRADGVPESLLDNCPFDNGVIGVCEIRYVTSTGELVDTTLLVLESHQAQVSEEEAASVFAHELGHCLGLKHVDQRARIMYPSTLGADQPSPEELQAISEVYDPAVPLSPDTFASFYFATSGEKPVRHFTLPAFLISATMGLSDEPGGGHTGLLAAGRYLDEPITVVRHLMRADGTCAEHY